MGLKEECGTCKFFYPPESRSIDPPSRYGLCRRYPMAVNMEVHPTKADLAGNGRFLRMAPQAWCGEYRSKITQKDIETLQEWAND